jgi:hypothetical protein
MPERAVLVVDPKCRTLLNQLAAHLHHRDTFNNPVTARELVEALTHYCASVLQRPGSWEAAHPFDFANYDAGGHGERWF